MPAGGRNWEGFSPDPYLTGVAMAETIKGIQDSGVIACAKHYIANEQGERACACFRDHALIQNSQSISAKSDGEPCCQWVGDEGAGHYVKMVHNGIEYGDMQLISEVRPERLRVWRPQTDWIRRPTT